MTPSLRERFHVADPAIVDLVATNHAQPVPLSDDTLLASFWTLAGNLDLRDPGPSPVSLAERAAAAARAGYAGMGLDHRDLGPMLRDGRLDQLAHLLQDCGLLDVELELAAVRLAPAPASNGELSGPRRIWRDLMRAAEGLAVRGIRVRHVKAGAGISGDGADLERVMLGYAELCDQAREVGTAVALEMLPVGPINSLERAMAVVGSAAGNGGLVLDAWHVNRIGCPLSAIAALPPGAIRHVELCDGCGDSGIPFLTDTTSNRLLCGDGEFDLDGFVDAVHASGYRGMFGVEILSNSLRRQPIDKVADLTAATARAVLDRSSRVDGR